MINVNIKEIRILLIILLFSCITNTLFAQELGDVNGDSKITITDALLVAQFYVNMNPRDFNEAAADVDCNGTISIIDALLIAQHYVGLITTFQCDGITPEPGTPTPVQGIDLSGRWTLDSHVNLVLNSEQTIYDHSIEEWTGEVEMSGYINDTITTDVQIRESYSTGPGMNISITLTTDDTVYPHYKITLYLTNHPWISLMGVNVLMQENETTQREFENTSSLSIVDFAWEPNTFIAILNDIPSLNGTDPLSVDILLNRDKTLTLAPDTTHKRPYPSYDLIPYITIRGDSFETGFIAEGDIVVNITGTVEINDNLVTLDFNPVYVTSYMPLPPIIMEILPGENDTIVLKRSVTEPSMQEICDYYGVAPSALDSYEYNQLFVLWTL